VFEYLDADDECRAFEARVEELERRRPRAPLLLRFDAFLIVAGLLLVAAAALAGVYFWEGRAARDLASVPLCAAAGPGIDCIAERRAVVVDRHRVRSVIHDGERDDVVVRYPGGGTATIGFGVHDADPLRPGTPVVVRLHHGSAVAVVGPGRRVFDTAVSPAANRQWAAFMALFFLALAAPAAAVGLIRGRRGRARL